MHKIGHQKRKWTIAHEQRHYAAGVALEVVAVPLSRLAYKMASVYGRPSERKCVITIKDVPGYYTEDVIDPFETKRVIYYGHSSKVFSDYDTAQAAIDNGAFRPDILGCDCDFCVTWRENNA